jgi:hypothetical protein
MKRINILLFSIVLISIIALFFIGCSPTLYEQQRKIRDAVSTSSVLEPLYSTDIYTIYYDKILKKCVMHSNYTVDQRNGVGSGIGICEFDCDPEEIKKRTMELSAD